MFNAAGCIALPFCETAMFLFSFSLYINLIPRNIRRLFCRQHNNSRKRNEKTVDVTNSMSGCNNLHICRIFLLISFGILTTLFFIMFMPFFRVVLTCRNRAETGRSVMVLQKQNLVNKGDTR